MHTTVIIINGFVIVCLVFSFIVDRRKTGQAVSLAINSFLKILPQILLIILLIGLFMGFLTPEIIHRFLGGQSGWRGLFSAALLGTVLHIPSIIAFPLAASILEKGAAVKIIAAFLTTLTMIGMITLPLEIRELGKKFALLRNGLSFLFALLMGLMIGAII